MDIFISAHEKDPSLTFEGVKAYFAQEIPDKALAWKRSNTALEASLHISEKTIVKVFEALVKKYPQLYVEASYSYDVREDDRSAQWWGTAKIYSEKENGETKIVRCSSTYWH